MPHCPRCAVTLTKRKSQNVWACRKCGNTRPIRTPKMILTLNQERDLINLQTPKETNTMAQLTLEQAKEKLAALYASGNAYDVRQTDQGAIGHLSQEAIALERFINLSNVTEYKHHA